MVEFVETILSLERQDWEFVTVILTEVVVILAYAANV